MTFANRDHLRCRAVHSNGHQCLYYASHDGPHCSIGETTVWAFWPEREPTLQEKVRARVDAMTDVEVQKLWKKLQEIE